MLSNRLTPQLSPLQLITDTGFDFSEGQGYSHCTFSADVRLGQQLSPSELRHKLLQALLRSRHQAPGIACSVSKLPLPERAYHLLYTVPKGADDALQWTDTILFIHDEEKTFSDAHSELAKTRYWTSSEDRYTMELHVYRKPDSTTSWSFWYVWTKCTSRSISDPN